MTENNYFCGSENEKFSFFRIPRALMKDVQFRELSTDAKLLYGLMLDRMGLSRQSGWIDADKRVYIYFTLDEIQNTLYCGHNKAVRILAELEQYALIERIKQGLGKPARIYVTNILAATEKLQRSQTSRKSRLLEVGNPLKVILLYFFGGRHLLSSSTPFFNLAISTFALANSYSRCSI